MHGTITRIHPPKGSKDACGKELAVKQNGPDVAVHTAAYCNQTAHKTRHVLKDHTCRTPSTRRGPPSTHCAVMYLSNVPVPFFLLERVRSVPGFLSHRGIRCMSIATVITSSATCPNSCIASRCTRTELAKSFIISVLSVLERIPLNHSSVGVVL